MKLFLTNSNKMRLKKIAVLLLLILTTTTVLSQTNKANISGKVMDSFGNPVPFANIFASGIALNSTSDVSGNYILKNVPFGSYEITVSSIGYTSQIKKIAVQDKELITLNFSINEVTNDLQEIKVIGKSKVTKVRESAFQVNAIDTKGMANVTANLSQVLNKTTGVKVREQGGMGSDFDFSINGLSGSAVKFFIDGVPLDIMGSSMSLNNIPVNLSERIEVYKGVVPVNLGSDALGGAVNIITNHQISNYLDMSYSLGSFNTHSLSLTGQMRDKKSGLTLKASGFLNYSDNDYTMKDVQIIETIDQDNSRFVTGDYKRFNDQYKSAMGQVELGFVDKPWADIFFIGASYSASEKGNSDRYQPRSRLWSSAQRWRCLFHYITVFEK